MRIKMRIGNCSNLRANLRNHMRYVHGGEPRPKKNRKKKDKEPKVSNET